MPYPKEWREGQLIATVKQDFFASADLDSTALIGDIDLCVIQKLSNTLFHKNQTLLWAEAKRGYAADNIESFIQLILTIGKAKTYEKHLPPEFIAAFNARQIAFIEFNEIAEVFSLNDFNFNVAPNNHDSPEFKLLYAMLNKKLARKIRSFEFFDENAAPNPALKRFIEKLRVEHAKDIRIGITSNNFFKKPYYEWLQLVKPTIIANFDKLNEENELSQEDFYLADLFCERGTNDTLAKANLRLVLKGKNYFLNYESEDLEEKIFRFKDEQRAHGDFWSTYERPPKEKYQDTILNKRFLLAPENKRGYRGEFFTPSTWALKAKEYLQSVLGKGFERTHYIWDCAAGTGNLLEVFDKGAKANIFASTLDLSDINVMQRKVAQKPSFPLPEGHIFQFDFLNDEFFDTKKKGKLVKSKLPPNLQAILKDENSRKKLIIFINPPYAEAGSTAKKKSKDAVSLGNEIYERYKDDLGKASNELFAQFFMRIYKEIPNCILASFSTLKYVNATNFAKFRQTFKAEFKKGFCVPANTFDNVNGEFPIGFLIWDLNSPQNLKEIRVDIFGRDSEFIGEKGFYSTNDKNIGKFISKFKEKKSEFSLGMMNTGRVDFQNQNLVYLKNVVYDTAHSITLTPKNLIPCCVFFAVRHAIEATWLNDRDQFLHPNDEWIKDKEFQTDCLCFTLFHPQNRISSKTAEKSQTTTTRHSEGASATEEFTARKKGVNSKMDSSPTAQNDATNHFIPFTLDEIHAKTGFASNFMHDFIHGEIKVQKSLATSSLRAVENSEAIHNAQRASKSQAPATRHSEPATAGEESTKKGSVTTQETLFPSELNKFIPQNPLKFSIEAKKVFEAGRELYKYYHESKFNDPAKPYNANASLYDIKEHFQGRDEKGKMNPPQKATDAHYRDLLGALNLALRELAKQKIEEKIYAYGFLRE